MIDKSKLDECYFLTGAQNEPSQREKRVGDWYCYIKNTYIRECPKDKCEYYYTKDDYLIEQLGMD